MRARIWVAAVAVVAGAAALALPAGARPCCAPVCVPAVITAFARDTKPGGEFAMEVDACGRLWRLEAEVDASALPPACLAAAEAAVPGGKVTATRKDWIQGVTYFEVEKEVDGRRHEVLMLPDGRVVGSEDVLAADKVPPGVLAAAAQAVPGGEVAVVEAIRGPEALGGTEHHVKTKVNGEVQRVSVLPGGQVGRIVRKIHAEVKLPGR